ncbi:hypothetical protein D9613_005724 [Agrocybe pediades]|uniref:Uncharacterized protein n=1 Tax=Agrocybe pediades TaxID=84607 RepID=A0A8H4VPT2_9AGAR|nr:hypothetical protein D9613_005724 [Agrocybe pediades]
MPPSRLIIDLNRCFEPNPFNTGPPIPTLTRSDSDSQSSKHTSPSPYQLNRTPDLSSSPSSVASSSLSLPLEHDEIKRIFMNTVECSPPRVYAPIPMYKEELNPNALPFVPSFVSYQTIEPSPLELGFRLIDQDSYYSEAVPPPPGLPYPPQFQPEEEIYEALPPYDQALLFETFRQGMSEEERESTIIRIVNSVGNWEIDSLLQLAEDIVYMASNPTATQPAATGYELPACDTSRYLPVEHGLRNFADHINVKDRPENIVAVVAELFHIRFLRLKAELGQMFVWNLRESILSRFIHCWDPVKPYSINFATNPSVEYVRSALALSKSIPSMFKRNLISKEHVSMCISIMLKDLMSVEHFDALSNLVLGCGPMFWGPTSDAISEVDAPALPIDIDNAEANPSAGMAQEKILLNNHVTNFLAGLEANIVHRQLSDETSVLGQPWGPGQFAWRVQLVVDSVNLWEAVLMAPPMEDEVEH